MRGALALGRRHLGLTAPNPSVGALVVSNGIVLGRGVTAPGGRPHAEPLALAEAGPAARGATLYVTLEPCSHYGHTPPCVDAVIAAGIARVVVAMQDPDERVAGRGVARLREAGIETVVGVEEAAARRDHVGHVTRVTAGRPFITLKMAETADGYAAAPVGAPRLLITGPDANARVQMLRAMHDAVMVGRGTATDDDPLLTVRLPGMEAWRPVRIVVDAQVSLDPTSRLAATSLQIPVLLLASHEAVGARQLAGTGVEVLTVRPANGAIDLHDAVAALGRRGLTRVLCEGGPRLASALILADLADTVVLFTAPQALGQEGRAALSPDARRRVLDPSRFRPLEDRALGADRCRVFERISAACSLV